MQICGFAVVRLPNFAMEDDLEKKHNNLLCKEGREYSGIDRLRWIDLHNLYYNKKLPQEMVDLRNLIYKSGFDLTGIETTIDFKVAKQILNYSNDIKQYNEIIAFYSSILSEIKEPIETNLALKSIGYDVFAFGEWSLIKVGIFEGILQNDWIGRLNIYGLFEDRNDCKIFTNEYRKLAIKRKVEDTSQDTRLPVDFIKIYKIEKKNSLSA